MSGKKMVLVQGSKLDFKQLCLLERILFLFGLDTRSYVSNPNSPTKLEYFYEKCAYLWWIAHMFYFLIIFVITIVNGSHTSLYIRFAKLVIETNIFWIWYVMATKRLKFYSLLRDIQSLGSNLNIHVNPKWINIGVIVIATSSLVSWITLMLPFNETDCKLMMK